MEDPLIRIQGAGSTIIEEYWRGSKLEGQSKEFASPHRHYYYILPLPMPHYHDHIHPEHILVHHRCHSSDHRY